MTLCSFPYRMAILLLVLAGCASTQNTLAQDIATDAWNTCRNPNIGLTRIEPDGRIWLFSYSSSYGQADFQACLKQYYANLGAKNPSTKTVPAVAVMSPTDGSTSDVSAPIWKPGYEWAYRYESAAGNGTYVWAVDREEMLDGVPHYVIKSGTREIFYRKPDLALSLERVDGVVVLKSIPSRLHFKWPMSVGQTWDQTMVEERPVARQTNERVDSVTMESEETVTVPAGTFKIIKVVCRNKKTGTTRYEAWYAPELRQVVKLRESLERGLRIRELIGFKLR